MERLVEHAWVLGLIAVGLWLAVRRALDRVWTGWAARAQGHSAVARLDRATKASLDADGPQDLVAVRGRLRVAPTSIERIDGGEAAAFSLVPVNSRFAILLPKVTPSPLDRRADGLMIVSGKRKVRLVGPVRVMAGSHYQFTPHRLAQLDGAVRGVVPPEELAAANWDLIAKHRGGQCRSVADGDEVVAVGRLVRGEVDHDCDGQYREAATQWALEPAEHAEAIALAARSAPTVAATGWRPGRRGWAFAALVALGAAAVSVNYAVERGEAVKDCRRAEMCRTEGRCAPVLTNPWKMRFVCQVGHRLHCARASQCGSAGLCAFDPPTRTCVATEAEHCLQSSECRYKSRCGLVDGACELTDAGCGASKQCREYGYCAEGTRRCATTEEGCRRSETCRREGRCVTAQRGGGCIADSDADCEKSAECRELGKCSASEGKCIDRLTDARCRASEDCRDHGRCAATGNGKRCIAGDPEHCAESIGCKRDGHCHKVGPRCASGATAAAVCRASEACKKEGRCSPHPNGHCVAARD
jgi:hypothetical protein